MATGNLPSWDLHIPPQDAPARAENLIADVRRLSQQLEKDFAMPQFPTFALDVLPQDMHARPLEGEEGTQATVTVVNHLPCSLAVDEVRIRLVNTLGDTVWMTSPTTSSIVLRPGSNRILLSSLAVTTGTYALDLSQIRLARVVFQYNYRSPLQQRASTSQSAAMNKELLVQGKQSIVVFSRDRRSVELDLEDAGEIHLDRPRELVLAIHPGRAELASANLVFEGPSAKLSLLLNDAQGDNDSCNVKPGGANSLQLSNIKTSSDTLRIRIPYEITSQEQSASIPITLEYTTRLRPSHRRFLKSSLLVNLTLPLSVDVRDFLRDDYIISKFSVINTGQNAVRVREAIVAESAGYAVEPATKKRKQALTLIPHMPANFIYRFSRKSTLATASPAFSPVAGTGREQPPSPGQLRIDIYHRSCASELSHLLTAHIGACFAANGEPLSRSLCRGIASGIVASRPELAHVDLSEMEDLSLGEFDEGIWRERLASYWSGPEDWEALHNCLRRIYQDPPSISRLQDMPWQVLSIPFEVPYVAIYNKASLELPAPLPHPVQVGDQIDVTLQISTSFQWSRPEDEREANLHDQVAHALESGSGQDAAEDAHKGRTHRMLYDLTQKTNDWFISGRVKGEFLASQHSPPDGSSSADNQNSLSIPLTLTPIRAGQLFLPSISIFPLPERGRPLSPGIMNALPNSETFNETAAVSVRVVRREYGKATAWIDRGALHQQNQQQQREAGTVGA